MTIHDTTRTDQQAPTIKPDRTPAQLAPGSNKTALKTCSKCDAIKPATLEYWHRDRHKHDNLSTVCKSCRRAFDRIRDPVRKLRPNRRLAVRVSHLNRRARSAGASGQLSRQDIQRQYEAQAGLCYWCSKPLEKRYDIDHITPFALGGDNTPNNVVCSCSSCNSHKSAKPPRVWLGVLASRGINHPDKPDNLPVQLPLFEE